MAARLPGDHADRVARMELALDALALGDGFGGQFFMLENQGLLLDTRNRPPEPVWHYTDDTVMALSVAEVLARNGTVVQDELAGAFARRYDQDWRRGYGAGAHQLLSALCKGGDWRTESRALFSGMGSFGNVAAMRVAPLAAYFAGDLDRVVEEARLSAEVTHAHPEGIAGAVAGAVAMRSRDPKELFAVVLERTPDGETRRGIAEAADLDPESPIYIAAEALGNGSGVTSMDTVPLCLWLAARDLGDYRFALWATVRCGGDVDTTGAIVGGIVGPAAGRVGLPRDWLDLLERRPDDWRPGLAG